MLVPRDQWLAAAETIVDRKHSLLICVPPNTGSLQFRMLAKRMQVWANMIVGDTTKIVNQFNGESWVRAISLAISFCRLFPSNGWVDTICPNGLRGKIAACRVKNKHSDHSRRVMLYYVTLWYVLLKRNPGCVSFTVFIGEHSNPCATAKYIVRVYLLSLE